MKEKEEKLQVLTNDDRWVDLEGARYPGAGTIFRRLLSKDERIVVSVPYEVGKRKKIVQVNTVSLYVATFIVHNGIPVYHTYRFSNGGTVQSYWYTTDIRRASLAQEPNRRVTADHRKTRQDSVQPTGAAG